MVDGQIAEAYLEILSVFAGTGQLKETYIEVLTPRPPHPMPTATEHIYLNTGISLGASVSDAEEYVYLEALPPPPQPHLGIPVH